MHLGVWEFGPRIYKEISECGQSTRKGEKKKKGFVALRGSGFMLIQKTLPVVNWPAGFTAASPVITRCCPCV